MNDHLKQLLEADALAPPLADLDASAVAAELGRMSGLSVYPRSVAAHRKSVFFLGRRGTGKLLGILTRGVVPREDFPGEFFRLKEGGEDLSLTLCTANSRNAAALQSILPYLAALPLGLRKSVGCGDRLGLATPGHIRAVRRHDMAPIFAQQSVRENARTGRNPRMVMDDAVWGVFQEGWRGGFGSDADHLKTAEDIDAFAAAGFTLFTFDPGEHVDNRANTAPASDLEPMAAALPWEALESSLRDLLSGPAAKPLDLADGRLPIEREDLLRAAAKYGRAIAHTARLYRHLAGRMQGRPFEVEMSVDETETVTSLAEHVYIARELGRLGVRWVSLAPRYVGTFEKGVDYIGDLGEFETSFARHLAVARACGPYKLSLHSGSDKFSVYPIAARLAGDLVHLKTAGTSYLEALRAVAASDAALFRRIVAFCRGRYAEDRASYHVSADPARMKDDVSCPDPELPSLLDDFHAREVLHVTFGSVLKGPVLSGAFFEVLKSHEETYYQALETHFERHLAPFLGTLPVFHPA